jgi:hypothetical protein
MKKALIAFFIAAAFLGCQSCTASKHCSPLAEDFIHKPSTEQTAEFGRHTLDEQYDIYICGTQVAHPPLLSLAGLFAQDGQSAVGFLKDKLAQAKDDDTIQDLILVFVEMSRQNTYNVSRDQELVGLLKESANRMKDAGWRKFTLGKLEEIKSLP